MAVVFDYYAFYRELNRVRKIRGNMTWSKLASRAGVIPSVVLAFARQYETDGKVVRKTINIDNMAKLMIWLGSTDISPFLTDTDDGTQNT